jgi:hypothetical protein
VRANSHQNTTDEIGELGIAERHEERLCQRIAHPPWVRVHFRKYSNAGRDSVMDSPIDPDGLTRREFIGAAGAIANAIYHATGKRIRRLPIHVEDLI